MIHRCKLLSGVEQPKFDFQVHYWLSTFFAPQVHFWVKISTFSIILKKIGMQVIRGMGQYSSFIFNILYNFMICSSFPKLYPIWYFQSYRRHQFWKKNWLTLVKLRGKACKLRQNWLKFIKIYKTGKISTQMCT